MSHDKLHTLEAFDPDEDLFDFAGVAREVEPSAPEEDLEELFASFRDAPPADELLTVPPAPAAPRKLAEPVLAAPTVPAPAPPVPVAEARAPRPVAAARPADEPRASEPVRELAPAARAPRFSRGVVAIAVSVTLLNSVLAVVMVRRRPEAGELRVPVPEDAGRNEWEALAAPPRHAAALPDPEAVDPVHDHPALDAARAEIARGEYSAARQRVYGLLAVIDRLEDPRRGALEGDCQFLIAQSLHLEALARMGGAR